MRIELYEYQTKHISELTGCDLVGLQSFLGRNNLKKAISITPEGVHASSFVGAIKYRNTQIEVLPKLLSDSSDPAENVTMLKNLIYMLSYTKSLDVTVSDDAKLLSSANPFLEVLIREFAASLDNALKRSTPKNYIYEEDNLTYIKGKINFCKNIKYNHANKSKNYCVYNSFSENIALNQLFLFVASALLTVSKDFANVKLLRMITNVYADIDMRMFTYEQACKITLLRSQSAFRKPLELAKMFLSNSSVDLSKNRITSFALMWDMNKLFEEFVYRLIDTKCEDVQVEFQKTKRLLKGDSHGKYRDTKVDILMTSPRKVVIDTKYKRFETLDNFANADVFQVSTYCLLHNAKEAILIYPQWGKEKPQVPSFSLNTDTHDEYNIKFRTVNLHIDIKENLDTLVAEIQELLR